MHADGENYLYYKNFSSSCMMELIGGADHSRALDVHLCDYIHYSLGPSLAMEIIF